jgi:CHASE2 domain-containing sensor protein
VVIHAHMISQILSAVQDQRSLLWGWSQPLEIAWISAWALAGGVLVGQSQKSLRQLWPRIILVMVALGGSVSLLSYYAIIQGGWIPLVPPLLTIATTTLGTSLAQANSIQRLPRTLSH